MQGTSRMDRELFDAGEIVGELVPAGSVFAFLAEHRGVLFDDGFIADLFPSKTGRPSLPADLVGSVLVLKELYGLSDPQTAEALKFDIRWKVACGRSLTQMSFDPSTLVYWRKRIAASTRPDRVFDKVAEVIAETGILRGRRKRCVDSTVFDDAVATQDTVTQLVAAIRRVARVVAGAAEVIAAVCTLDYSNAGKPDIDWDDPTAKRALVSDLVNDALAVLEQLTGRHAPERDQSAADALGLLALVAGQDVEPAEGSDGTDGRWVIARKVAPDRVISTVDPQARHTRKSRSNRRDGYRGHLATEPDTGLITDCEMTMTTGEANTDAAMGVKMANRDRFHHTDTNNAEDGEDGASTADAEDEGEDTESGLEVYGDSAYSTGDNTRPMSPARTVTFGRLCADCPLRQRCTTAKTGRSMTIHPHEDLLRAARAQARTPRFKQDYPTRSNVERTVAQVATQNGRRVKLRHIGAAANNAWLHTRCAALNLRTLLRHGLTRTNGAWAIA